MPRALPLALALGLVASAAAAQSPAPDAKLPQAQERVDKPASILGEWVGTYTCAQGLTGVTLTITEATPRSARALFHFYADPSNPSVPTGCFTQTGAYDAATGHLALRGERWLLRPPNYIVVGFVGDLGPERLDGVVTGAPGCTSFHLVRRAVAPPAPLQCRAVISAR